MTRLHPHAARAGALLLAAAGLASAQPLPVAAPDSVGFSAERLNRIDAFFADEMQRKRVPGAVVAVARQGRLVYFKAFGQADPVKGLPMTTDTIFWIANQPPHLNFNRIEVMPVRQSFAGFQVARDGC